MSTIYLGELGATHTFIDSSIESVTVKGSYEVLEGDGGQLVSGCCGGRVARAFQTPLDADGDALNKARNSISGQAFDLEKVWAYVQFKY